MSSSVSLVVFIPSWDKKGEISKICMQQDPSKFNIYESIIYSDPAVPGKNMGVIYSMQLGFECERYWDKDAIKTLGIVLHWVFPEKNVLPLLMLIITVFRGNEPLDIFSQKDTQPGYPLSEILTP